MSTRTSTLVTSTGSARRKRAHSYNHVDHDSSCEVHGDGQPAHNHAQQQLQQHNNNRSKRKSSSPRVNTGETQDAVQRTQNESDNKKNERESDATSPSVDSSSGKGGTVELVRKIGQGSCGAVYLGRHPQTQRDYAVKLIPKDAEDQRTVRLLQRVRLEGDLLLMLDHPHIVRGYGVIETDAHAFLFMEHAQGGDLLEYLNHEGALTEDRARLMFRQVVKGVRYLHQNGWVHRDIKPENIFIAFQEGSENKEDNEDSGKGKGGEDGDALHDSVETKEGSTDDGRTKPTATITKRTKAKRDEEKAKQHCGKDAKTDATTPVSSPSSSAAPRKKRKVRLVLGDFGFARQYDPREIKRMQECVGTFPYAAPEVINRKKYIGPEVDVWSLGVVLLAMLTAQMPFGAPTEEMSRALAAAGQFSVPPHASDAALDLLTAILQPDAALRITLEGVWRHPWMRTSVGDDKNAATNQKEGVSTPIATDKKKGDERTSSVIKEKEKKKEKSKEERKNKNKKKEKEKEKEEKKEREGSQVRLVVVEEDATKKKRSPVHRAASLLLRRTTNVMGGGGKKRGRSTSAMATSAVVH